MLKVDSIDELDNAALQCRANGHDWPRSKGVEWFWTKQRRGRVIEAEIRRKCASCGTIARRVYTVEGGEFTPAHSRYTYPSDVPYLLNRTDPTAPRPAKSAVLGLHARRAHPGVKFG